MSFAGDLEFHHREIAKLFSALSKGFRPSVEREALSSGKAYFEFFNEQKQPSPTGLLCTPWSHWWVAIPNGDRASSLVLDIDQLRLLAYPKFLRYKEWGGDHGASVGVTIDLSRLGSFMVTTIGPVERNEIARLRAEILRHGCPPRPPTQDCLWPNLPLPPPDERMDPDD